MNNYLRVASLGNAPITRSTAKDCPIALKRV
jgi:hypothetical protein